MEFPRLIRQSGILSVVLLVSACFTPYGFAGGGLPTHVRTVAIIPFENQTPSAELQRELVDAMRREMERRLGLRDAPENRAHAIVRGTITRYEPDVPVAFSADPNQSTAARRRVQIVLDVEIVDQTTGKTLWQRKGLSADGEYPERGEAEGRRQAISRIVNSVIEGAQSQW